MLAFAVVAAAVLRAGVLASDSLGVLDSDEAVVGLMARHALDGELPAFFWGQSYGGTLEPLLAALVFAVAGSGVLALKLVPILLFAAAGVLVWLIGRRTIGERGAAIAVLLFAIGPAYVVWWSTKERGFYGVTLVLSLVVVLLVLRLRDRVERRDLALLGVALGLGWWTNAMIGFIALPALCWLVWRRPEVLRQAWIAVLCAAVAASLWIREAVVNDFAPLHQGPEPGDDGYLDHLNTFFAADLPMALGLRIPFSLDWPAGEIVGRLVELVAVGAVVWALVRRRGRPWELLAVIAVAYPFLFAFAPVAAYNLEPCRCAGASSTTPTSAEDGSWAWNYDRINRPPGPRRLADTGRGGPARQRPALGRRRRGPGALAPRAGQPVACGRRRRRGRAPPSPAGRRGGGGRRHGPQHPG